MIGILNHCFAGEESLYEISMPNKKEYAERHGYKFIDNPMSNTSLGNRTPDWEKVFVIINAMVKNPDVDLFFWSPVSFLFTNMTLSIEDFVLPQVITKNGVWSNFIIGTFDYPSNRYFIDIDKDIAITKGMSHKEMLLYSTSCYLRNTKRTQDILYHVYSDQRFRRDDLKHLSFDEALTIHYNQYLEQYKDDFYILNGGITDSVQVWGGGTWQSMGDKKNAFWVRQTAGRVPLFKEGMFAAQAYCARNEQEIADVKIALDFYSQKVIR